MTNKKSYSKLNLFIRSFIFSIYAIVSVTFYSILVTCAFPLPLRFRCALIRGYLVAYIYMLKVICHIDYRVEGMENITKARNGIIFSKHQSTWETFFLPTIFNVPAAIAKRELLWVPFFGWGFAASEPISINRNNKAGAMQQIIREGKKRLEQGRWIMFFPEGTRVAPKHTGHYKLGGARLAAATGYPVIPVAHNAGHFWPRRGFLKRPGTIQVFIGPVIESEGRTAEEILEQAKTWIEGKMKEIE